jgi:hypothetical protein
MRRTILTPLERKIILEYLEANGEKTPTVRSIARYAKELNVDALRKDLVLIGRFQKAYHERNGSS